MLLAVVKHGDQWEFLGRMFKIKGPNFERLIRGVSDVVSSRFFDCFFNQEGVRRPMDRLVETKQTFKHFPFCRYATDVTFQMAKRPCPVTCKRGRNSIVVNIKYTDIRWESLFFRMGMPSPEVIITLGQHRIWIFSTKCNQFMTKLWKIEDDEDLSDVSPHQENFQDNWGVLIEKGYQGPLEFVWAIYPEKKPHGMLAFESEYYNQKVARNRIITEKYFGRMCGLWAVTSNKFRWAEENYDKIFRFCMELTNVHIKWNPLRAQDQSTYLRVKNR